MQHDTDSPDEGGIMRALQAAPLLLYSADDDWMSEITASQSHKFAWVGRDL